MFGRSLISKYLIAVLIVQQAFQRQAALRRANLRSTPIGGMAIIKNDKFSLCDRQNQKNFE